MPEAKQDKPKRQKKVPQSPVSESPIPEAQAASAIPQPEAQESLSQESKEMSEAEQVQVGDGATSASGRIKIAEKDYSVADRKVEILFKNGSVLASRLDDLPGEIVTQLALHGLSQKLGDSYASAKGDVSAAFEAASKVMEQLKSGVWKAGREGGDGEGAGRVTELAQAVARFKNVEVEKAIAALAALPKEKLKEFRAVPAIKAIIAQIRLEKANAELAKSSEAASNVEITIE